MPGRLTQAGFLELFSNSHYQGRLNKIPQKLPSSGMSLHNHELDAPEHRKLTTVESL